MLGGWLWGNGYVRLTVNLKILLCTSKLATSFAASIFNGATSFSGNFNSISGDASSLNSTEESQSQNNMGTGLTTIVTVET